MRRRPGPSVVGRCRRRGGGLWCSSRHEAAYRVITRLSQQIRVIRPSPCRAGDPGGVLTCPHDRRIHRRRLVHQTGRVRDGQQALQHGVPGLFVGHPAMPGPDRLPRTEYVQHIPPGDPAPLGVNDSFDHRPGIGERPASFTSTDREQILDQRPLRRLTATEPRHDQQHPSRQPKPSPKTPYHLTAYVLTMLVVAMLQCLARYNLQLTQVAMTHPDAFSSCLINT